MASSWLTLPFTKVRAGLTPGKAKLETIRGVMPILGGVVHAAHGVLYFAIGLPEFAWSALAAVCVFGVSSMLLRFGMPRLAMWLAYGEVAVHVAAIEVILGSSSGFLYYYFPLVTTPFLVFKPSERAERRLTALYPCVATPVLYWYTHSHAPIIAAKAGSLEILHAFNVVGTLLAVLFVIAYFDLVTRRAESELEAERARSEKLLLNVLPAPIAKRLKGGEITIADHFGGVSVLFADIVGFTPLSQRLSTTELVNLLNTVFSMFDRLAAENGLEKIKTIGDAYMVVSGVPEPRSDHAAVLGRMALAMRDALAALPEAQRGDLKIRIGLHSGPVVAGIIGEQKFAYDLWGDTVNTASRMESHGEPGKVHVSREFRAAAGEVFAYAERGPIVVKGKGEMCTFFVERMANAGAYGE